MVSTVKMTSQSSDAKRAFAAKDAARCPSLIATKLRAANGAEKDVLNASGNVSHRLVDEQGCFREGE